MRDCSVETTCTFLNIHACFSWKIMLSDSCYSCKLILIAIVFASKTLSYWAWWSIAVVNGFLSVFLLSLWVSTFCLDAKGGIKSSRQTRTAPRVLPAYAQQHAASFCIIHFSTVMQHVCLLLQLFQKLMLWLPLSAINGQALHYAEFLFYQAWLHCRLSNSYKWNRWQQKPSPVYLRKIKNT